MNHSYLLAGIRFSRLVALISRNGGISWRPGNILRILFLLQNGIWASLFSRIERLRYRHKMAAIAPPNNPVFIIGHWRTGSTLLHQLLSIDSQWLTPTVFEVSVPEGFLVSRPYYRPVMSKVLGSTRPMDNVKLGFDEPQEDEYALLKLCPGTPLEKLIFPDKDCPFLAGGHTFIPNGKQELFWRKQYTDFCRRLLLRKPGRLLFKNPFHSLRIPLLYRWFPQAVFINITRHPSEVLPSTRHMWDVVGSQNCLNGRWQRPGLSDIARFYNYLTRYVSDQLSVLPANASYTLSYQQLTVNPFAEIKALYAHFGWEFTDTYQNQLREFIASLKGYKTNNYAPNPELEAVLKEFFSDYPPYKSMPNNLLS